VQHALDGTTPQINATANQDAITAAAIITGFFTKKPKEQKQQKSRRINEQKSRANCKGMNNNNQ
jgi:hypothetical protein